MILWKFCEYCGVEFSQGTDGIPLETECSVCRNKEWKPEKLACGDIDYQGNEIYIPEMCLPRNPTSFYYEG